MSRSLAAYTLAAQNNAWASATMFEAIGNMDTATFTAERPGFFKSLSRTLNHIYEVDLYILDALEEGRLGRKVFEHIDVEDPRVLAKMQTNADLRFITFCENLTEGVLGETRKLDRKTGLVDEAVSDILPHVLQHQIHHRGQAHVQLQDAGIAPPQLDEFYIKDNRSKSAQTIRALD